MTYPITGVDVGTSRPEWFSQPYQGSTQIDPAPALQVYGDVAHRTFGAAETVPDGLGAATDVDGQLDAFGTQLGELDDRVTDLETP